MIVSTIRSKSKTLLITDTWRIYYSTLTKCLYFVTTLLCPQMRLRLRSAPRPTPGTQAAGPMQPSHLSTRRGSQPQLDPLPTALSPPAPPPLPLPSPPCPAATRVPQWGVGSEQQAEAEGYRAGATAPSACWRPPAVRPRTTTTPTGLVGRERWRTSTPSTKWVPGRVFFRTVCGVVWKVGDETLFFFHLPFFLHFPVLSQVKVCSATLYISQWLLSLGFHKRVWAEVVLEV